jgi:hypothetical protein
MATAANPLEGIQQDKDGNYFDVVDLGDGSGQQVFKGKTIGEVLGQYRKAQANATRKIREQALQLKLRDTPDPAQPIPDFKPHTPTADELWQLSEDLKDPARAVAALNRATEWRLGTSLDEVRGVVSEIRAERVRAQVFSAGEAFMDAHPEYKRCVENETAIFSYLDKNHLAYTRKNFEIAFEELKPGLVLISPQQRPNEVGNEPEARIEQPVVTRPRTASTGLSPRVSSAVPPRENPTAQTGKLTASEIDAMPTAELERKLRDPVWAAEAEKVLQAAALTRR